MGKKSVFSLLMMIMFVGFFSVESSSIVFSVMLVYSALSFGSVGEFFSSILVCDLMSFSFVYLTLAVLISCKFMWFYEMDSFSLYLKSLVLACVFSMIAFSSSNMLIFYLCFESSVIPTMFIIMAWGYQPERIMATKYLILYTLVGSMPLLSGLVLMNSVSSLDYSQISMMFESGSMTLYSMLFSFSFSFAFLIKTPMFFFHLWLPKAHVEAPVVGSMFLAAILLKLGSCGIIRMKLLYLGNFFNVLVMSISVVSIVMVGVVNLSVSDMKVVIAYSSVSHMAMGLALLCLGDFSSESVSVMMFTLHGSSSSAMFMIAYVIYLRFNSRVMMLNKMLVGISTFVSFYFFMFCLSMMGAPPSMNIMPEAFSIMILSSQSIPLVVFILGVTLCSFYTLHFFSLLFHREKISINYQIKSTCLMEELSCFWSLILILGFPMILLF